MKKTGKIILTILSLCSFLWLAFWITAYYINGLSYLYYTRNVVVAICVCCAVLLLVLALIVAIIVIMFKSKETMRVISVILLIVLIPVSFFSSLLPMAITFFEDPYGCSYTEDIANYGKYDRSAPLYFPKRITQDMTVVDFTYYYKFTTDRLFDITHTTDIYLEVEFDDKETMKKYLTEAKKAFSEGSLEYRNPYNANYVDVIRRSKLYSGEWRADHNYVSFGDDKGYRYVNIDYCSITYSYEELTIIYNYTYIGPETEIGNRPDKGEYYPKILERFGVEWNKDSKFSSSDMF